MIPVEEGSSPLGFGEHAILELGRVGLRLCVELEAWLARRPSAATLLAPLVAECRDHLRGLVGPPLDGQGTEALAAIDGILHARIEVTRAAGRSTPLMGLRRDLRLSDPEIDLLLLAALPEASGVFASLFSALTGLPSVRRPTVHVALEVCRGLGRGGASLLRLIEGGLLRHQILHLDPPEVPLADRVLRIEAETWLALCGVDAVEPVLQPLVRRAPEAPTLLLDLPWGAAIDALAGRRAEGLRVVLLGAEGSGRRSVAREAARRLGLRLVEVHVPQRPAGGEPVAPGWQAAAVRHALLRGAGLLLVATPGPGEPLELSLPAPDGLPILLALPERTDATGDTFASAPRLQLARPPLDARRALWRRALVGSPAAALDPDVLARRFRLNGGEIAEVLSLASARSPASGAGAGLQVDALLDAIRERPALRVESQARRVRPRAGPDDLILPRGQAEMLDELHARARNRDRVYEEWRMSPGGGRLGGVVALFAGPSGTGKTLAAEVIAGRLGFDLYCIDLSQVVSKYIGETEKNLARVFDAFEGSPAVLFFDEADGIFGKRTETKDAHDRYANLEVSYLLARLDAFAGLAIMASNLRQNIDHAFLRRMDFVIDFPMPDTASRRLLWERHLRGGAPLDDDIDLPALAEVFPVSGANIRNAVVGAAFAAAESGCSIGHRLLCDAMRREYEKLGKSFPEVPMPRRASIG